jgi:hypothetical protein
MHNRGELRQKRHNRSGKRRGVRGGNYVIFGKGEREGINIVFEPKYRPIVEGETGAELELF